MVDRFFYNKKYKHIYCRRKKFKAHDEEEFCIVGDKVVIKLCRPISKTKRFFVRNIVKPFPREYHLLELPFNQKISHAEEDMKIDISMLEDV